MAFIYEVNGQKVQFDREPTEADIDEAARELRPKPQSAQTAPVEGAGGAAFGMYRPAGRRPESQNQNREDNKDMALQTVRGAASAVPAIAGIPGSIANAVYNAPQTAQNLYNRYSSVQSQLAGAAPQPLPEVPKEQLTPYDMAYFSQMVPGPQPINAAGELAFAGGQALGGGRLPMDAYRGVRAGLNTGYDVARGALGRGFNYIAEPGATPGPLQVPSSRVPIGNTYVDPAEFAAFQRGELPYGQFPQNRPINQLPQGALDRAALAASGGEIPLQGQGARAFGERIGQTYRSPVQAALDIGSMFATGGIPVLTAGRTALAGIQGLADMRLASKGFSPEVPGTIANYRRGLTPMPGSPGPMPPPPPPPPGGGGGAAAAVQAAATQRITNLPQLGYTPGAGSPTMYVSPEGVVGTNLNAVSQAGAMQKYAPEPVAQPMAGPIVPTAPAPQQSMFANMAADKKAAAEEMVRNMMARQRAEKEAALAATRAPEPVREVVPFESTEARAAAQAEARAERTLTMGEKLDKTVQTAYRPVAGQGNVLDKTLINQTLAGEGLPPVDFDKLGIDYQSMSVKDARKTIKKFVETETGLKGPGTRGSTQQTIMKQANEKLAAEEAALGAEEKTQRQAALEARLKALGNKYRAPGGDRFNMMTAEPDGSFKSPYPNIDEAKQDVFSQKLEGKRYTKSAWMEGKNKLEYEGNPQSEQIETYRPDKSSQKMVRHSLGTDPKTGGKLFEYHKYEFDPEWNGIGEPVSITTSTKPDWWPDILK